MEKQQKEPVIPSNGLKYKKNKQGIANAVICTNLRKKF